MQHYIETTIISNKEIPIYYIWQKLYTKIHLALVEQKDENDLVDYGVSFPHYKVGKNKKDEVFTTLGEKLRIFASDEAELQKLNIHHWLSRLIDYVHISSIKVVEVSKITGFVHVSRYRPKPNINALARRYAMFKKVSIDNALARYQNKEQQWKDFPFIRLKSLSGSREFSLCINQLPADKSISGKFNTYGLSAEGNTLPNW